LEGRRRESFELFKECLARPEANDMFRAAVFFLLSLDFKENGVIYTRTGIHLLHQFGRQFPEQIDDEFKEAEKDARDLLKYQQSEAARRAAALRAARKAETGLVDSDDDDDQIGIQKLAIGTEIEGPAKAITARQEKNPFIGRANL
jgi:hypothetical protein